MNHHLDVVGDQHDDLEQVAGAVGAKDEPTVRVLAGVLDYERVIDGVDDVVIVDTVSACR